MIERPILFNTEMVKAILSGEKTQTRRIIKKKYDNTHIEWRTDKYGTEIVEMQDEIEGETWGKNPDGTTWRKIRGYRPLKCPYSVGDILWVRETWADTWTPDSNDTGYVYKADGKPDYFPYWGNVNRCKDETWIPSIHMPRKAARVFLKVTSVSVERLQDITEEGARSEGFKGGYDSWGNGKFDDVIEHEWTATEEFLSLWNSIYFNVSDNPWVWVIEFEKLNGYSPI